MNSLCIRRLVRRSPFFLVVAAGAGLLTASAHAQDPIAPGTKRMSARLQEMIAAAGLANPNADLARAESARAQLAKATDPREIFGSRLDVATALLNGGKSEQALAEFIALREFLSARGQLSASNRTALREKIALCYLRIGEQENCLHHHTTESCLAPIEAGGVHKLERGSRGAIKELLEWLEEQPENLTARWLLNIASMTLGEYPAKVPAQWRIDPKVFASEYPLPRFRDVAGAAGVAVDGLAGGSITEDFDGDGLLDVVASSMSWHAQLQFFHNNGDGTFSDRTAAAGLTGELGGLNIMQTDYNNDGRPDILVLRGGWQEILGRQPLSLLRNEGQGRFADVTEAAGLLRFHPTQTATWFDYDNDGWLDLFVGNEAVRREQHPCELFRNNRDGTFTECAAATGADVIGFVKGVANGDFNNDGRCDLYLSRLGQPNVLLRNDGLVTNALTQSAAWRFSDVSVQAAVLEPTDSFPTWFFDYDNDGWLDLFVSGYFLSDIGAVAADYLGLPHNGARARLYHNNRDGTFTDVAAKAGLYKVLLAMGSNFGDLDHDGWLDFYLGTGDPDYQSLVPNRMFRNNEGRNFQDVTTAGGFGHLQKGHGISFADLDNDGDQDIYQVVGGALSGDNYRNVLFENPGSSNRWIGISLVGTPSNRAGIGARIKVTVETARGPRVIYQTVNTGGSFGCSPLRQQIGLGAAKRIQELEIFWPVTGQAQKVSGMALDRYHIVREGKPAAEPVVVKSFKFSPKPHQHQH